MSAQRSYRTSEHEALAVIKALMEWEDKLVGWQFMIVTDHEALETVKTTNWDGKSGRLICWDEYLSRFKYEIMHVPSVLNKVADCLSCYYENDSFNEIHESHHYVSANIHLDPQHENITGLRLKEITEGQRPKQLLARRLCDRDEDHIIEAEQMASALQNMPEGHSDHDTLNDEDITIGEALQSGPPLHEIVYQDDPFIEAVKDGYKVDSVFSKIIDNPGHYPTFRLIDGILHTKNQLGDECMCMLQSLL